VYDIAKIAQDQNPPWPPVSPYPKAPRPDAAGGAPSSDPPVITYLWDPSGNPVAHFPGVIDAIGGGGGDVTSVQGRVGAVVLIPADLASMGGAPLASPALIGNPTAPTPAVSDSSSLIANTLWVRLLLGSIASVSSFNGRSGAVVLNLTDVMTAGAAPNASPLLTGTPRGPTAAPGDQSVQLATTAFVATALSTSVLSWNGRTGNVILNLSDVLSVGAAPLASPAFTGTPTAPTPVAHDNTTKLATTAYVDAAVIAGASGVATFNGRNGTVVLIAADVSGVGGALLASPAFTGSPTGPTPPAADNTQRLATTAFVAQALASAGVVASFNGRTGVVTLIAADIIGAGGAPAASPALTGTPTAPTAAGGTSSTQIATTAFVGAAVAPLAPLDSPPLTGTPTAPTAAPGTNTTQLATTAFATALAAAGYLPLAGGALTGPLSITLAAGTIPLTLKGAAGGTSLVLDKAASGQPVNLVGETAGLLRWALVLGNAVAESGANAGSDFVISRYSDAGAFIDQPLTINRATGTITTAPLVVMNGASGAPRRLHVQSAGSDRWQWNFADATAEGAGSAGSNMSLNAYDNTGVLIGGVFNIIRSTRVVTFNVAIVNPSDRRLKERITPIANALDIIAAMNGIFYHEKAEPEGRRKIGLIADDVADILPEVVHETGIETEDGKNALGIDYPKLTAVLIEAVKELTARVTTLEAALGV
jgi:Chaperone of endosialidase